MLNGILGFGLFMSLNSMSLLGEKFGNGGFGAAGGGVGRGRGGYNGIRLSALGDVGGDVGGEISRMFPSMGSGGGGGARRGG